MTRKQKMLARAALWERTASPQLRAEAAAFLAAGTVGKNILRDWMEERGWPRMTADALAIAAKVGQQIAEQS